MSTDAYISIMISIVALIISIIALVFTVKAFLLKAGISIRGVYVTCSSIACEDRYISSLTLENLKDRAVIIFKIYLKIGHNYFIELDNFEEEPLILKPFEVFRKEYGPIDFYCVSTKRIRLDPLFENKNIKKQLVISTSNGRYNVRTPIEYWDPIIDFFRNHMTALIHPMRSSYKGKSYGINAKYIVNLKMEDGTEKIIPIYPRDYQIKKFRSFNLTKESLESKDALWELLYCKSIEGLLPCVDVSVNEMDCWYNEVYELKNMRVITASHYSWFRYQILGRIGTLISDYQMKKKNKEIQKNKDSSKNIS